MHRPDGVLHRRDQVLDHGVGGEDGEEREQEVDDGEQRPYAHLPVDVVIRLRVSGVRHIRLRPLQTVAVFTTTTPAQVREPRPASSAVVSADIRVVVVDHPSVRVRLLPSRRARGAATSGRPARSPPPALLLLVDGRLRGGRVLHATGHHAVLVGSASEVLLRCHPAESVDDDDGFAAVLRAAATAAPGPAAGAVFRSGLCDRRQRLVGTGLSFMSGACLFSAWCDSDGIICRAAR